MRLKVYIGKARDCHTHGDEGRKREGPLLWTPTSISPNRRHKVKWRYAGPPCFVVVRGVTVIESTLSLNAQGGRTGCVLI